MPRAEDRLEALGLPPPPSPVAAYLSTVRTGKLVFVCGHGPMRDSRFTGIGKLGRASTSRPGTRPRDWSC